MKNTNEFSSNNVHGIIYMMLAILMLSSMDAVAKWLVEADYSPFQIISLRGMINLVILMMILPFMGGIARIKTSRPWAHGGRSAIGFFAPIFFYASLSSMALAEATAVFFVSPFIMTALSVPLFGEKVGIHRWAAILIGFAGVLYIVQPTSDVFNPAALLVLGAALCYSLMMLWSRSLGRTEHTITIMFYINVGSAVLGGVALPFVWKSMSVPDMGVIGLMALLSMAGHYFIIKAFTTGEVGVITPFEYTGLLWAVLLGYVIFGEIPAEVVWTGMALIGGSGLYLVYRENRAHRANRAHRKGRD
ncbi:DMT family transporter [Sneathiella chinensis]|uniref:Membrane protein n=1 Tax=Sneathiella chinensis TaxID=349750 RepID=A0ABQ5TZZ4_9PROT|nr:DMT family transporter [Sneathiella chinensis]GLQ05445.1 membrane protein [Sneathiella chinensis]